MATTTNYSWTTPNDTDLVKDGASAIRTLGSAIDTTVFNNAGAAVAKSTIDAKGDLLVGTADNTVGRLAVGTDGFILQADSSVSPTGLKWAAPAGSSPNSDSAEVTTGQQTNSTSYTDLTTSGPAVTVTTGTKALVIITGQIQPLAVDQFALMSYAVSGTTTIAANDKFAIALRGSGTNGQNVVRASSAFLIKNLTAGSNTFTAKYRVVAGTGEFFNRQITVIDLGS